ncbi:MAG: hypothetical protein JG766_1426, partial [Desulfacinum sp.]|nr:hypothetical protein [Desulfacinum sp.]
EVRSILWAIERLVQLLTSESEGVPDHAELDQIAAPAAAPKAEEGRS